MNTVEDNRRKRLALLEREFGTQAVLAEKIGKSPAQVSQWKNASRYSGSEKRRAMDRHTARHIEKMTGKPEGWMDQPLEVTESAPPGWAELNENERAKVAAFISGLLAARDGAFAFSIVGAHQKSASSPAKT